MCSNKKFTINKEVQVTGKLGNVLKCIDRQVNASRKGNKDSPSFSKLVNANTFDNFYFGEGRRRQKFSSTAVVIEN